MVRAPQLMHGKTSQVHHGGTGLFAGAPEPVRGHPLPLASWSTPDTVPDVLEVTATTADGVVMGLRHRSLAVEGVQFHPESILTPSGPSLLGNFLDQVAGGRRCIRSATADVRSCFGLLVVGRSRRGRCRRSGRRGRGSGRRDDVVVRRGAAHGQGDRV